MLFQRQIGDYIVSFELFQPVPDLPACKWEFRYSATDLKGNELPVVRPQSGSFATSYDAEEAAVAHATAWLLKGVAR